jgi:ergothioneine biosynthesis protein EgtB
MHSTTEVHKQAGPGGRLGAAYEQVRAWTMRLVEPLTAEDQMVQSMPDASPSKWHLAHTAWFFETFLLSEHLPGYQTFDPDFRQVYNSYYKKLGAHPVRSTRGTFSRPPLDRVLEYRHAVDESMSKLLHMDLPAEVQALVDIGLNHEQQHQELILTDIKHGFWSQPLRPPYRARKAPPARDSSVEMQWIDFPGGVDAIGYAGAGFAFDNEYPRHEVLLQPYRLASRLVTNAEFLRFIEDDGYRRPELWLSEGWDTVCQQGWAHPLYWDRTDAGWQQFTIAGMEEIGPSEPACHISYFEADAYARWAGARLPREDEWEVAAPAIPVEGNFAESELFAPTAAANASGLQQMFGDVWEWTASPYVAYPGFRTAAGAVGEYNGKFMCNQFVLRGGSCATPRSHMRASYRNFFPAHARWQFTGIRLAADES